jgi:hypothetical protein
MSALPTVENRRNLLSHARHDVVVVGAGPYGLSAAAHLQAKGLNVAIFGKTLESWREWMPAGMFLRSFWWATSISDPGKQFGLNRFFQLSEHDICFPEPIQMFIDYGMWFQQQVVPSVDPTYVDLIEREGERFILTLQDGRVIETSAVVMAIGHRYFKRTPPELAHLPAELLTHSADHGDSQQFAGKKVAVIGGGQSAVEFAALLNEAGASVEVISRRPVRWLEPHGEADRSWLSRLRAPDTAIGPGWKYRTLEIFPYFFQRFSSEDKERMVTNAHVAGASHWLKPRILGKVNLRGECIITQTQENNGGLDLSLSDHTSLHVDHILSATGYRVEVNNLALLSQSIRSQIKAYVGAPVLNPWFESSVPGLYFIGLSSMQSFGPLYRFVAGTSAASPRVAKAVVRHVAKAR